MSRNEQSSACNTSQDTPMHSRPAIYATPCGPTCSAWRRPATVADMESFRFASTGEGLDR
jgi:hypothetical protein